MKGSRKIDKKIVKMCSYASQIKYSQFVKVLSARGSFTHRQYDTSNYIPN